MQCYYTVAVAADDRSPDQKWWSRRSVQSCVRAKLSPIVAAVVNRPQCRRRRDSSPRDVTVFFFFFWKKKNKTVFFFFIRFFAFFRRFRSFSPRAPRRTPFYAFSRVLRRPKRPSVRTIYGRLAPRVRAHISRTDFSCSAAR